MTEPEIARSRTFVCFAKVSPIASRPSEPGAARRLVTFLVRPRKVTKRNPPRCHAPLFKGVPCAACLDEATAQLDLARHTRRASLRDSNSARRQPLIESSCSARHMGRKKRAARFACFEIGFPQKHLRQEIAVAVVPHVSRRAARPGKGGSARTVRVPWQSTLCVLCQVEFRSRLARTGSAGLPSRRGGATPGRPSFAYFSWPRKKST